jgi:hypothetical protein
MLLEYIMRVLSIDVGMKHLAFCMFVIENTERFTVEKWDIINLCTNNQTKKICMGSTKKGKKCEKSPKFYKNDKYYCKIHAKNRPFLIPTNNFKEKRIKKLKVVQLRNLIEKYNIKITKKKPLKSDYLELILSYIDDNYFNFIEKINAKDFNLVTYGRNLKDNFNTILGDIPIECLIIENQIGPLALRMKTLQGMIMQHFIERNCPIIEEISPLNKLKEYIQGKKTTYNERKKLSIEITKQKINEIVELAEWETHFIQHKKKDDLADALLQGIWYLKSSNLMKI